MSREGGIGACQQDPGGVQVHPQVLGTVEVRRQKSFVLMLHNHSNLYKSMNQWLQLYLDGCISADELALELGYIAAFGATLIIDYRYELNVEANFGAEAAAVYHEGMKQLHQVSTAGQQRCAGEGAEVHAPQVRATASLGSSGQHPQGGPAQ